MRKPPPVPTRRITAIQVGRRHRQALGDLDSLAESLDTVGLLHPVVIDPTNRLIARDGADWYPAGSRAKVMAGSVARLRPGR